MARDGGPIRKLNPRSAETRTALVRHRSSATRSTRVRPNSRCR